MARFAGKIVIVTGAASGIGEGAARRFAAEGATLVLGDKKIDGLHKLATQLGTTVETIETDVSDAVDGRNWPPTCFMTQSRHATHLLLQRKTTYCCNPESDPE